MVSKCGDVLKIIMLSIYGHDIYFITQKYEHYAKKNYGHKKFRVATKFVTIMVSVFITHKFPYDIWSQLKFL